MTIRRSIARIRQLWLATAAMATLFIVPDSASAQVAPATEHLVAISSIVEREIALHHVPGAVVIAGNAQGVFFRQAFGNRILAPVPVPMTPDAVFDLASLTKVIATTTAVMQLSEQGRLDLDARVASY